MTARPVAPSADCPICARPLADGRYRPFCSKRCADVDLARWLTGGYALPSDDPEDAEEVERALSRRAESDEDEGPDGPRRH